MTAASIQAANNGSFVFAHSTPMGPLAPRHAFSPSSQVSTSAAIPWKKRSRIHIDLKAAKAQEAELLEQFRTGAQPMLKAAE